MSGLTLPMPGLALCLGFLRRRTSHRSAELAVPDPAAAVGRAGALARRAGRAALGIRSCAAASRGRRSCARRRRRRLVGVLDRARRALGDRLHARRRRPADGASRRDRRGGDRRLCVLGAALGDADPVVPRIHVAGGGRPAPTGVPGPRARDDRRAHAVRDADRVRLRGERARRGGRLVVRGARAALHAATVERAAHHRRGAEPPARDAQPRARASRAAVGDRQDVVRGLASDAPAARHHPAVCGSRPARRGRGRPRRRRRAGEGERRTDRGRARRRQPRADGSARLQTRPPLAPLRAPARPRARRVRRGLRAAGGGARRRVAPRVRARPAGDDRQAQGEAGGHERRPECHRSIDGRRRGADGRRAPRRRRRDLAVTDAGPGIAPADREAIFSPFFTRRRTARDSGSRSRASSSCARRPDRRREPCRRAAPGSCSSAGAACAA